MTFALNSGNKSKGNITIEIEIERRAWSLSRSQARDNLSINGQEDTETLNYIDRIDPA